MALRDLLRSARLIGFDNSARAVAYAVQRIRLDRRDLAQVPASGESRGPGRLVESRAIDDGEYFSFEHSEFEHSTLEVRHLTSGGVFVSWDEAAPLPSYALTDPPTFTGHGGLDVEVGERGDLTFTWNGDVVRRDAPPTWTGDAWALESTGADGTAYFGLGGKPTLRLDGTYRLWNRDPGGSYARDTDPLSLTMPVCFGATASVCTIAFYDNSFDGTATISGASAEIRFTAGPLRYYVLAGTPSEVVREFTGLTGRPALPPRWALGYHHSRWGLGSEKAMREIVDGFRRENLPLSGLWMDIDHMRAHRVFTVDERRYPTLERFTSELARDDIHTVAIVDPGLPVDDPRADHGMLCRNARGDLTRGVVWPGWVHYPDFTSEHTREWWGRLYKTYVEKGIAGFWHDMNEPSAFAAFGEPTLPLSTHHDLDGRGGDHREAHNVYGLTMNRAAYDGVRALRPERRPFLISRSGWAGLQRYAGTWSGDIEATWDALRMSLGFTLGLGLCGVPYSGPDIGGFDGTPSPELYLRWFQLASYLPFFRTHSSNRVPPREPWLWDRPIRDGIRRALTDRYELLPYWYSLAWQAFRTGTPYVRPVWWEDRALLDVDDAFLVGDALLVAPVLSPGVSTRTVRLPSGRWFDRATGHAYDGPGEITVPVGLSSVPVFARAGSVIPVDGPDGIELEAWPTGPTGPGGPGDDGPGGLLVTDAGDGWDEPTEERFAIDSAGAVTYDGPAESNPYRVRRSS